MRQEVEEEDEEVKEKNVLVQWRKMKITSWGLLRGHVMGPI